MKHSETSSSYTRISVIVPLRKETFHMARFKDCFFGKLVSAEDRYHKQPYRDWRTDFVVQEDLIVLFESEHKAPGKVFFHMLVGVGKWMYCTVGDWSRAGKKIPSSLGTGFIPFPVSTI